MLNLLPFVVIRSNFLGVTFPPSLAFFLAEAVETLYVYDGDRATHGQLAEP